MVLLWHKQHTSFQCSCTIQFQTQCSTNMATHFRFAVSCVHRLKSKMPKHTLKILKLNSNKCEFYTLSIRWVTAALWELMEIVKVFVEEDQAFYCLWKKIVSRFGDDSTTTTEKPPGRYRYQDWIFKLDNVTWAGDEQMSHGRIEDRSFKIVSTEQQRQACVVDCGLLYIQTASYSYRLESCSLY